MTVPNQPSDSCMIDEREVSSKPRLPLKRRPQKCEVDRVNQYHGSIAMSSSDHNKATETAQVSARFQSSGAHPLSRRVYQNTKTQGGHLHQGDHYGDKVYNIVGGSKEVNLFQAACDTIEASLPIEQCVDLIRSLVSSEDYTLPGDSPTAFDEVVDILESLDRVLYGLKVTERFQNSDELVDLIPDCESIINDLRAAVDRTYQLHGASEPLHRSNCLIRRFLIEFHGEDLIPNLAIRMELVRRKVYGSIKERVSCHMSQAIERVLAIEKVAKRYGATGDKELLLLVNCIKGYTNNILSTEEEQEIKSVSNQLAGSEADTASTGQDGKGSLQRLLQKIKRLEERIPFIESNLKMIESLHFKMIEARHRSIMEPYESTFTWILEDVAGTQPSRPVEFVRWLRSRSGAFLLRGKAGSGKSTMMKYIFDHSQTRKLLKEWAGKKRLVMAKHFFWRTGNKLQRSIVGLLRTLLFEILRAQPDFTVHVLESLEITTASPLEEETGWTRTQLEGALTSILRHGGHEMNTKFCFFIDGLDEFEESDEIGENQGQLLLTLKEFCDSEHIKFCVSSRPTNMLWNAFLDDSGHRLQLENLTRTDIENMLKKRLKRFPQDLKHVFGHMMNAIDSERLPETALFFWLATSIDQGELAVIYSAVDDILDHGNVAEFLKIQQNIMSEDDSEIIFSTMESLVQ
ncbi:hypothetical protein CCHR01_10206 [Colletotrichum chrysophilum]|uniref:Nephrocystin 3-like N-terminal domain-containing protein n=1 Tax=Colletotrichum chrysophilum TaxID=1836956 RepID=A0AAD9AFC2_9PEZI|nr:hypothetical protein CCHR01_10206 [Colletotrichum chrysophilum]